jgi:hypothetical protein
MLRKPLILVLAFFASASAVLWVRGASPAASRTPNVGPLARQRTGHRRELLFVVLGSSYCHGVRAPGFKEQLSHARQLVQKLATARGNVFGSIGVALDPVPDEGLAFLREFGPFDEIDVGNSWESLGVTRFIWRGFHGEASVPQVLVVSRDVVDDGRSITIGADRLLAREIGSDSLIAWSKAGAPLPPDTAASPPG